MLRSEPDYSAAIQFLYDLRWFGAKLGLANTIRLAELAGNPHHKLRFIHVAGTNGKGSTCAMLENIYRAAGLRVGLFTSPHLVAFGERIQVNRRLISESGVVRLVAEMRSLLEQGWGAMDRGTQGSGLAREVELRRAGALRLAPGEHPTFFEVVTVMALRYFAEQKSDLVIWETGLGGRLDATNIVTPLASVITNVQYDHQEWLGETLASISAEKAGIIKPGVPVITATDQTEALQVIEETARKHHSPLTVVSPSDMQRPPPADLALPLLGRHQRLNAAVAVATVRALASQIPVTDEALRTGLSSLQWPGRLQLVTRPSGQQILLDGAHNVAGAEMLAVAIKEYFPSAKPTLILGILQDKDWAGICRILTPLAGRILVVPVASERSATPQKLGEACRRANPAALVVERPSLSAALGQITGEEFVVITGSLYLIGEALERLEITPAMATSERELNEWVTHL